MKKTLCALVVIVLVIINIVSLRQFMCGLDSKISVIMSVNMESDREYQLFYVDDYPQNQFSESKSTRSINTSGSNMYKIKFSIPEDSIDRIRIDFGNTVGKIGVREIKIQKFMNSYTWRANDIKSKFELTNDISNMYVENGIVYMDISGVDPYIVSDDLETIIGPLNSKSMLNSIAILIFTLLSIIELVAVRVTKRFITKQRIVKILMNFKDVYNNRQLILQLAKNDFKTRYAGSFMGIMWAFVQPVITIFIYWFVFQIGFRVAPMGDFPYLLWFIAGIVPWFFFSDIINFATNSLFEYSYLVKKVIFKVGILPIVKATTALFIHVFFIGLTILVYGIYGFSPSIYTLQILYYSLCTMVFGVALSYVTSAIVVFVRDFGQVVSILLQFGVWLTPIMWPETMVPLEHQWILRINPIYYIVEGYRNSFINHIWFFNKPYQALFFWLVTILLLVFGVLVFKKLKPHFADIL